jgi:pimeloyl-CoA synthetase
MKMTDDEAAMYLHNCMGDVCRQNGKKLYIDNIFADVIDSAQYYIHHGHLMMQQVLSNLRKRLDENGEKGIPVDGFPNVDASIPEDAIDEIRKEAKAAINNILGLSKDEEK